MTDKDISFSQWEFACKCPFSIDAILKEAEAARDALLDSSSDEDESDSDSDADDSDDGDVRCAATGNTGSSSCNGSSAGPGSESGIVVACETSFTAAEEQSVMLGRSPSTAIATRQGGSGVVGVRASHGDRCSRLTLRDDGGLTVGTDTDDARL